MKLFSEIMSRIYSQDYKKFTKLMKMYVALGNVDRPAQLSVFIVINEIAKNPKMEAHNFYRFFGGRPRVRSGVFQKI